MALLLEQIRRFSTLKTDVLDKLTRQLYQLISNSENEIYQAVIKDYLTKELSWYESGQLKNIVGNYASTSRLDRIFNKLFTDKMGKNFVQQIGEGTDQLYRINSRYFSLFDKKAVEELSRAIEEKILKNYGLEVSGKVRAESSISNILKSNEPLNSVKNLIHQAIASESLVSDLEGSLRTSIIDDKLLTRYMDSTQITNIYDKYDRQTSQEYSTAMGLDYAIYQGGEVEDTRPFCHERNGKVFTREEVEKFGTPQDAYGGYTNKSLGEFKGKFLPKTKVYDPITDLGGYNCRHHLGWITYELAVQLRPDLKKSA